MKLKKMFEKPKKYMLEEVFDYQIIEKIEMEEKDNSELSKNLEDSWIDRFELLENYYDLNRQYKHNCNNYCDGKVSNFGLNLDGLQLDKDRFALLVGEVQFLKSIIFSYRQIIKDKLSY